MRIGEWNSESARVFIIAEIGNNHEGSYDVAVELIERAAEVGVDAVKFQTFDTNHYVTRQDSDRHSRLKRFELTYDEFRRLARVAHEAGVLFISTPFDLGSARFLHEIADALKISSSDNQFLPLLDEVASTGLPVIVSTGLLDLADVNSLVRLYESLREGAPDVQLAVLHCVTSYPVPKDQANIFAVSTLVRELNVPVGYSDHTVGNDAAILAVGCGARIIEKHFTLDHAYSDFRDHQLSADPEEMRDLVRRVRAAESLLGDGVKRAMACEQPNAKTVRRSIAAARDLPVGTTIAASDLTWVRPGDGIPPGREHEVVGRVVNRPIPAGYLIRSEDLDER